MTRTALPPAGAAFLCGPSASHFVTPETIVLEPPVLARAARGFMTSTVLPAVGRLEQQERGLLRQVMRSAGEAGLLGFGIPAAFGGTDLCKTASLIISEITAAYPSFAIAAAVHAGVGCLPLLWFGADELKSRFLPGFASGAVLNAFALTEPNAGSDALSARTQARYDATRDEYVVDGAKAWISNANVASVFTVFAMVQDKLTAILVERDRCGVTVGPEEPKMGLNGSSTAQVGFEQVRVPATNVLAQPGAGSRCALSALNAGRLTIGAISLGVAKHALALAARYALVRRQFGRRIADMGLIEQKLGNMASRLFALESMIYRIAGYWDDRGNSPATGEEYAVECAIVKFHATEVLDYVVDEALQIHGAYGYSERYEIARLYRDARVFRIFEGTNEVNRLSVFSQIDRRIKQGRVSIESRLELEDRAGTVAALRFAAVGAFKEACSMPEDGFGVRQVYSARAADLAADLLACESAWLRAARMPVQSTANCAVDLLIHQACARHGIGTGVTPPLLFEHERRIAEAVKANEGYPW